MNNLTPRSKELIIFVTGVAAQNGTRCIVAGATALIMRGVLERKTRDLDVYIELGQAAQFAKAIEPILQKERREGLWIEAARTKFRFYKAFDHPGLEKMKTDVIENVCIDVPEAASRVENVEVATVPLMAVFKICAIARSSTGTRRDKAAADIGDLQAIVIHMKARGEVVSDTLLQLMNQEPAPFLWSNFWRAYESDVDDENWTETEMESGLQAVGFKKTRD